MCMRSIIVFVIQSQCPTHAHVTNIRVAIDFILASFSDETLLQQLTIKFYISFSMRNK